MPYNPIVNGKLSNKLQIDSVVRLNSMQKLNIDENQIVSTFSHCILLYENDLDTCFLRYVYHYLYLAVRTLEGKRD